MLQEGSHNLIPEPASRCGSSYRWFHYSGDWSGRVSWELPNRISGCYTDLSSEPPKSQETFHGKCFQKKTRLILLHGDQQTQRLNGMAWPNSNMKRWESSMIYPQAPGFHSFHLQFHYEFRHRATELVKLNLAAGWTVIQASRVSTTGRLNTVSWNNIFSWKHPKMSFMWSTFQSEYVFDRQIFASSWSFSLQKNSSGQYQFRWFTHSNYWNMVIFHS